MPWWWSANDLRGLLKPPQKRALEEENWWGEQHYDKIIAVCFWPLQLTWEFHLSEQQLRNTLPLCACHLCIYLTEGDDWLTETHLWKLVFRAKQSSISTEVSSKKSGLGNNKNIYILEQISSQEQPYTRRLRNLRSKTVKISSLMHFSNSIAVAVLFACLTRSILFKWIYRGTSLSSGLTISWAEYRAPAYFINRRRD